MLPNDPFVLVSYINTKLRDEYPCLSELCGTLILNEGELVEKLASAGFVYDEKRNRFV